MWKISKLFSKKMWKYEIKSIYSTAVNVWSWATCLGCHDFLAEFQVVFKDTSYKLRNLPSINCLDLLSAIVSIFPKIPSPPWTHRHPPSGVRAQRKFHMTRGNFAPKMSARLFDFTALRVLPFTKSMGTRLFSQYSTMRGPNMCINFTRDLRKCQNAILDKEPKPFSVYWYRVSTGVNLLIS